MYVEAQTLIIAGGVLSSVTAFFVLIWKLIKWINHQKEQDEEIKRIDKKIDTKVSELQEMVEKEQNNIQDEQTLVIYGLLACLKGLAEQGCDGPVAEAINKIEKHINLKAHHQ